MDLDDLLERVQAIPGVMEHESCLAVSANGYM
jgi:hypothetical protein